LIPFNGGEARKLTSIDGDIREMQWSPDGRKLLCAIRKTDAAELEKTEQQKKLGVVARHYDRLFYKLDGEGYLPHERTHLWLIDARTGKAKQLTDHKIWDEFNPTFSPDGRSIAFFSNHASDPDLDPYAVDLIVISADGGESRGIKTPEGYKSLASFSPDGKFIVACGETSDMISVHAIDAASGTLSLLRKYPGGKGANWVEIVSVG
jgi:Tol biopolymer transport system component